MYRASPSSAAKNIINLISALTIWWCPCIESSLVLLERVHAMTSMFSWKNSVSLCPASCCTPRPNLLVTPGISWLPASEFQSPMIKRTPYFGVSSGKCYRSSQINLSFFNICGWGVDLDYCDLKWFALKTNRGQSIVFEIAPKYYISDSFVDYEGYSISSKGILPTIVDTIDIWIKFTHSCSF